MKKQLLRIITMLGIISAVFLCSTAFAEKYDIYTYTVVLNEYVRIDSCSSPSGEITIPAKIEGLPVTTIGSRAFNYATNLTSVTIPDSVTVIESNAFYNCTSLENIKLSEKLATIGSEAFYNCQILTDVTLPDSLSSIGSRAFYRCNALKSINIPSRVSAVGTNAFAETSRLAKIEITDISAWASISFAEPDSNPLYFGKQLYLNGSIIKDIVIPNGITHINDYAFYNCDSLTSIRLPASIMTINSKAFYDCSALNAVFLTEGITSIYDYAFYGCSALNQINFPDGILSIGNYAFNNCSAIKILDIPESVISIGDFAFYNCSGAESITLVDGLVSIGECAFNNCSSIIDIYIPKTVTTVGSNAFGGCSKLTRVDIDDLVAWLDIKFADYYANPIYHNKKLYLNNGLITDLVVPDGVKSIGAYTFYGYQSLASVTIPDSIESIGKDAFYGCSNIQKVYITDVAAWCGIEFGSAQANPLTQSQSLYLNNKLVTNLVIPDGVETIGNEAFYNCTSLVNVTIPASVTSIEGGAFYNCSNLVRVNISDIGAWCNISFGTDTANPLYYAEILYLNNKMVSILVIPEGVTTIKKYVFNNCQSLTRVYIPESMQTIENRAFYNCTRLSLVNMPDNSVSTIGNEAFRECTKLASVTLPESLAVIGDYVFYNCNSITIVTVPGNILDMGTNIFCDCDSLETVYIKDNTNIIPEDMFYYCRNLKNVHLPMELMIIESGAFGSCPIENVYFAGDDEMWDNLFIRGSNDNLKNANIICNVLKKTYRFKTNCSAVLSDITDYAVFVKPKIVNGDNEFLGWYDNKLFTGEPVSFPYYGDATTLYAKWDGNSETKTISITDAYGECIYTDIPANLPEEAIIILACYNGEKLTYSNYISNSEDAISFDVNDAFDSAKIMVWNGISDITPACDVVNVSL